MAVDEPLRKRFLRLLARILHVELPKQVIDPIDQVFELPDDPTTAYVWKLNPDQNIVTVQDAITEIRNRFIKRNNRLPQSIHFITDDEIEYIEHVDADTIKNVIKPWVDVAKQHKAKTEAQA